jgi:hypothetical protein
MNRRNISNEMSPLVAIDFDSIVLPPEPAWWWRIYEEFGRRRWTRRLHRWLLPVYLSRYKLTRDADTAGWWLVDKGLRIKIIVRRPYSAGITKAVEQVLGDFPNDLGGFHLVTSEDMGGQSMDIHMHCRAERVMRFYTRDKELAKYLPTSLVRWVDQWDESVLR